jgi:hypothetical protein
MTITSKETDVQIQQFPIILGQGGEITIPLILVIKGDRIARNSLPNKLKIFLSEF